VSTPQFDHLYALIEYRDRYGVMPYYMGVFSTKEKAFDAWKDAVAARDKSGEESDIQIEEIPLDTLKSRWNVHIVKAEE
jgi:hypothetical protein